MDLKPSNLDLAAQRKPESNAAPAPRPDEQTSSASASRSSLAADRAAGQESVANAASVADRAIAKLFESKTVVKAMQSLEAACKELGYRVRIEAVERAEGAAAKIAPTLMLRAERIDGPTQMKKGEGPMPLGGRCNTVGEFAHSVMTIVGEMRVVHAQKTEAEAKRKAKDEARAVVATQAAAARSEGLNVALAAVKPATHRAPRMR
ncbi:hypothetical protein LA345_13340 [Burkholderia vietnamiensis]|uniref:Uncharacterized protein n=1 Tax=Burkholderia vietnamiensis (strain G4 / LMG 22486) TaxID=269482 RepID=A4JFT8_BURVG|nr:hypothetical protein Bcep1808_2139 [Burkholderia vietnamiensis G4]MCB4344898.1 hypothetical protein [Burkholderia vietnamiensis]